jgi:hypothetical protein
MMVPGLKYLWSCFLDTVYLQRQVVIDIIRVLELPDKVDAGLAGPAAREKMPF